MIIELLRAFVYDQFSGDQEDLHHEPHHQYLVPVQDVNIELSVVNISMQWSGKTSDMNRTYIELSAKGSEYQQSPRWKAHWHVIGTEEQQDYKDVG